jgi:hypothetical protein
MCDVIFVKSMTLGLCWVVRRLEAKGGKLELELLGNALI